MAAVIRTGFLKYARVLPIRLLIYTRARTRCCGVYVVVVVVV
jgi:hypothetical protein